VKAGAKVVGIVGLALFGVVAAFFTWAAVMHASGSVEYLHYLATRGELVDTWAVLSTLDVLFGVIGVTGAWLYLWRRRLRRAAAFLALTLVAPVVVEASRCHVEAVCRTIGWAALPAHAFDWSLRIRDVSVHEAAHIAGRALRDAGLPYSPWAPRLSAGWWRLETRTENMALGPYEVLVEARTGKAKVVRR
jgi:hypothetical protein